MLNSFPESMIFIFLGGFELGHSLTPGGGQPGGEERVRERPGSANRPVQPHNALASGDARPHLRNERVWLSKCPRTHPHSWIVDK